MRMPDIINRKKRGEALSEAEIAAFVQCYTCGDIPDYQAAALLMAICFVGMTAEETAVLTACMANSGDLLDLSDLGSLTADKHSTGGVGDKTTLLVAPICAAAGLKIAKMSGRGLGHTGGTIDKLESIPGFCVELSERDFKRQIAEIGLAVIGQSADLAPADKKLYALRDVTGTVDSIPLIAASVMCKKLAAGAQNIALDVKCGSGAFMQTQAEAKTLAQTMVEIGKRSGRHTAAVITNMDSPLGTHIGNALEVTEACNTLRGHGAPDLRTLSVELSAHLLSMSLGISMPEARARAEQALTDGSAFAKLQEMVAYQGGDAKALEQEAGYLHAAAQRTVRAERDGWLTAADTKMIGECACVLGAGRAEKAEPIDYAAGLILHRKTGDWVQAGEPLATLYAADTERCIAGEKRYLQALTFGEAPPPKLPLILDTAE